VFDKEAARKRMKELEAEVKAVMADTESTAAEKHERMDRIEAEDKELSLQLKNHARALAFRAGNELGDADGSPADTEVEMVSKPQLKHNVECYQKICEDAATRKRGSYSFEFNSRIVPWHVGMKAQGVASMMGESTSGTSAGSALAGGSYFLAGTAGAAIAPQFIPGIVELKFYENVIASLWPSFPCSSPVVTYVREATRTNAAAGVGEGATKPTSSNTVTRYTEQIGKIATLVRVTDELIQDAPLFWALAQRRGAEGIARQEEVELLAGTGYPGVHGLFGHAAAFTQGPNPGTGYNIVVGGATGSADTSETATSVTPGRVVTVTPTTIPDVGTMSAGAQLAEGLLSAMTDIRYNTFFEPDAVVLNPADYQVIRLAKDNVGQYLGGSFFGMNYGGQQYESMTGAIDTGLQLWNKRVVTTPAIPAGTAIVGDFGDSGQVLRLGGLRSDITNVNGTDFEQNLWTARYEERVGLMIERPELYELVKLVNQGS